MTQRSHPMKCRTCGRAALFRSRGKKGNRRVHADKNHDLCQRCFRDLLNAQRRKPAKRLPPFPPLAELIGGAQ